MPGRLPPPISLALLLAVTGGGAALAQTPAPPAAAPVPAAAPQQAPQQGDAPAAAPGAGGGGAADNGPAAGAASGGAPGAGPSGGAGAGTGGGAPTAASKGGVMGYAYKSHAAPSGAGTSDPPRHRHLLAHHPNEAVATFTGFEMLADGGSRIFVQLSKQIEVEQGRADDSGAQGAPHGSRKGKHAHAAPKSEAVVSRLKFVLKGAEVVNPMNEGALATMHFNTPVVRARLVPSGRDLHLVMELRADVTPQMKVVPAKDSGAMLQIDFPQGSYLPAGAGEASATETDPAAGSMPGTLPATGANDSTGRR